jgi:hypothetical protein
MQVTCPIRGESKDAIQSGHHSRIDQKAWTIWCAAPHRERENHWDTDEYRFDL